MEYNAEINDEGQIELNGEIIDESIFNEERVDYSLRERDDFIDTLIDWISEATKDKEIMKSDLRYLMKLNDEYIWSSILTNKYIAKSDNREEFNNICKEVLKLNKTKD